MALGFRRRASPSQWAIIAAGGFITDEQADTIFLLSSLQLIVHAFSMVGGKKMAETATNSAMWEKPNVHGGFATHEAKIRPFFDAFFYFRTIF